MGRADRLWADDIVIFVPGMAPMDKAQALGMYKDGVATFTRFETSDLHPRVTGDLAIVTGRLQRTRNFSGRVASDDWQFRKVYRRDGAGWRVISYHAWPSAK
jgi:ketosteroid isomerase-like protein